ncbi:MAG: RpiB/LacA/LacB family sugar-phosphate isomerase [Patescibacteria group bacterium]
MKIFIGADHRGFAMKELIKFWLISLGHEVVDCGNIVYDKEDDFPDFAFAVAERIGGLTRVSENVDNIARPGLARLGLVFCGSGGGVTITANKVKGIRCVTALSIEDVKHNREHNDANVLAIATDIFNEDMIKKMIEVFLFTQFVPEDRFIRRIGKIKAYEEKNL